MLIVAVANEAGSLVRVRPVQNNSFRCRSPTTQSDPVDTLRFEREVKKKRAIKSTSDLQAKGLADDNLKKPGVTFSVSSKLNKSKCSDSEYDTASDTEITTTADIEYNNDDSSGVSDNEIQFDEEIASNNDIMTVPEVDYDEIKKID